MVDIAFRRADVFDSMPGWDGSLFVAVAPIRVVVDGDVLLDTRSASLWSLLCRFTKILAEQPRGESWSASFNSYYSSSEGVSKFELERGDSTFSLTEPERTGTNAKRRTYRVDERAFAEAVLEAADAYRSTLSAFQREYGDRLRPIVRAEFQDSSEHFAERFDAAREWYESTYGERLPAAGWEAYGPLPPSLLRDAVNGYGTTFEPRLVSHETHEARNRAEDSDMAAAATAAAVRAHTLLHHPDIRLGEGGRAALGQLFRAACFSRLAGETARSERFLDRFVADYTAVAETTHRDDLAAVAHEWLGDAALVRGRSRAVSAYETAIELASDADWSVEYHRHEAGSDRARERFPGVVAAHGVETPDWGTVRDVGFETHLREKMRTAEKVTE